MVSVKSMKLWNIRQLVNRDYKTPRQWHSLGNKTKRSTVQRMVMERSHNKDETNAWTKISNFTKNTQRFSLLASPLQQSFSTESSQIPPQKMSIRFKFHFHFLSKLCLLDIPHPRRSPPGLIFSLSFSRANFFIILKKNANYHYFHSGGVSLLWGWAGLCRFSGLAQIFKLFCTLSWLGQKFLSCATYQP